MKLVGMFLNLAKNDSQIPLREEAFLKGMKGWTKDKDVRFEYRFGGGEHEKYHQYAQELVALKPDVIFAGCGPSWSALETALQDARQTIPIVFAGMIDPTSTNRITSDNSKSVTGYVSYETILCKTWPGKLKQIAPQVVRVAVIRDPGRRLGKVQFDAIESAARTLGLTVSAIDVTESAEAIKRNIAAFAGAAGGGLIVPGSTLAATRRDLIIGLAAQHRLPAIYPNHMYTTSGGLISYGAITLELYESAGSYADRILKGASPSQLPVIRDNKFELVINLKTANAMGLDVPNALLSEADEVMR